jgi:glycosyltransferase involved in cell wall biosynthesis
MVDAASRPNITREQPRVSIVTAVYNGAKHLQQTIESVLGQTYPNIEYIIIDGGSTDGTLDIIRNYEKSLRHWVSRPDNGMYFAMNEGIGRSSGELVGIINGDDWYERDAVQAVVDEYVTSDRQTIFYGIARYYDEDGLDMILSYDHGKLPSRMINHPACFVPKKIYSRVGMFDTRYRIAADYDFLLRAYRQGVPFKHVERIIASFRHGGFSSRNRSAQEVLRIQLENGYKSRAQYLLASALGMARRAAGTLVARIRD